MNTFHTSTGNFPIGFRRGGGWQKDLPALVEWAKENGLAAIDLSRDPAQISVVEAAGLQVGSIDLLEWQNMLSPDKAQRDDAVAKNCEYVENCGARNYFTVMLPQKAELSRRENFAFMVESFNALAPAMEKAGGHLVIEGWPGPGALCCTPESYRAFFKECSSQSMGINYDPSHLLRMGIDPLRFLNEFVGRVYHVHGKDAQITADDLYNYGHEQAATFKDDPPFGGSSWRYTIPGEGDSNWKEICRVLQDNNYTGAICIELEDMNYNGSEEGEKRGFLASARFLSEC